jgi:hypothetical protein
VTQVDDLPRSILPIPLDIGDDDHDHLITPGERFKLAMARQ